MTAEDHHRAEPVSDPEKDGSFTPYTSERSDSIMEEKALLEEQDIEAALSTHNDNSSSGGGSSSSSSSSSSSGRNSTTKIRPPRSQVLFWVVCNIVSTVAIVFINKTIFTSPSFNSAQFFFASYHLTLTYLLLSLLSWPALPAFKTFDRRPTSPIRILPLAASMSLTVVFLNTSLAFCSVPFYQTARVLLTPVVALINYLFLSKVIPRQAAWCLVPVCAGVAFMAYSDTKDGSKNGNATSLFGAGFALTGVLISAIYTVWIGTFHDKLDMNSTQLLHAQSPVGACLLFFMGLVSGRWPDFAGFDGRMWTAVFLSGLCACMINLSQFRVINLAGSLAGTIVGQVKTIVIVVIGWIQLGEAVNQNSILGVCVAITGVVGYIWAERKYGKK